ncbi:hypothetical protein OUZ56_029094 [Daphnia magna]|uniref:Uncharacterized protein n=1 Tax=Daphnia magna TaxID=35525 RepID=A0ABR0B6A8_9CRUS|nr:hypothetical protein OUZ56_029094 [Daphnia magna]
MVYNLCGYLLHSRKYLLKCEDCLNTLETSLESLPPDFSEAIATNRKDRGGLKYCTKEMFDLFIIVEEAYRAEVDLGKLNILDWFERSMETLGVLVKENKFNPTICCDTHRKELVGKLVLEYLIIRNHLETKKWVKEFNQQSKSKSLQKQAKVIS